MRPLFIVFVLALGLILAACGSSSAIVAKPSEAQPTSASPTQASLPPTQVPEVQPGQTADPAEYQLTDLTNSQGAVTVIVKPLDLGSQEGKLKFEVTLDTHSVDLSMNLAALSSLSTDTGLAVQAEAWDAPQGGHHVSGTLTFPASTADGKVILDGASKLTLVIKDVDAPERTFTWDLK
jgi:hypothetical protein